MIRVRDLREEENPSLSAAMYSSEQESLDGFLVNRTWPHPMFFVSVASKGLRFSVSDLESTLAGCRISVDSKDS